MLLKEVGLALQRNHIHKVEGVGDIVDFVIAKGYEEAVGNELNVLAHQY